MGMKTVSLHQKREAHVKISAAGVFVFAVSMLFAGNAAAQVYRCKNAEGRLAYSDKPCVANQEPAKIRMLGTTNGGGDYSQPDSEVTKALNKAKAEAAARGESYDTTYAPRGVPMVAGEEWQGGADAADDAWADSQPTAVGSGKPNTRMDRMMQRREARMQKVERQRAARLGKPSSYPSPRRNETYGDEAPEVISAPPPQPSIITNCDPTGCWDNLGNRYNNSGTGHFWRNGQFCVNNGGTVLCH